MSSVTFPILYNKDTKQISVDTDATQVSLEDDDDSLQRRVDEINRLTRDLVSLNAEIPESPEPSAQLTPLIKKLITSGVESLKAQKLPNAIKQLTLAIDMAGRRARWEAFAIQLQELNAILQIRCDAYLLSGKYLEAYNDADLLLSTQVLSAENFLRKAIAALNLGRFEESRIEIERGLCFHPENAKMKEHLDVVCKAIALENGDL